MKKIILLLALSFLLASETKAQKAKLVLLPYDSAWVNSCFISFDCLVSNAWKSHKIYPAPNPYLDSIGTRYGTDSLKIVSLERVRMSDCCEYYEALSLPSGKKIEIADYLLWPANKDLHKNTFFLFIKK